MFWSFLLKLKRPVSHWLGIESQHVPAQSQPFLGVALAEILPIHRFDGARPTRQTLTKFLDARRFFRARRLGRFTTNTSKFRSRTIARLKLLNLMRVHHPFRSRWHCRTRTALLFPEGMNASASFSTLSVLKRSEKLMARPTASASLTGRELCTMLLKLSKGLVNCSTLPINARSWLYRQLDYVASVLWTL